MVKLKYLPVVITICVTVCVLAVIGFAVLHSWAADMAISLPLELVPTEFSSDGGATWTPVGTGEALNRQRGDVAIRGHFNFDIMEGWVLHLYFRHMQMEMWVNGERVASFAREFHEIRHEWCTDIWMCFEMPEISTEDLVELVDKAHELGMRVVLDAVFNHTAPEFFAFYDLEENWENSPYRNWYYCNGKPKRPLVRLVKPNYKCFSYFGGMPKVNL